MSTDEVILNEMIGRATAQADGGAELAVKMFCMVVRSNALLVQKAQEMIMNKINSNNVSEAIKAVELLEECMNSCGSEFQDEVNKFRFLNGLIRLVSDKFAGRSTALEIKNRIMDCLLLWTTQFPEKTKIREAYDNLNKSGFCKEKSLPMVPTKKEETVLGKDELVFSKLVKSNDPEDFKRANKLVQFCLNQETKRKELLLQHKSILQEVQNTVMVLEQMLRSVEQNVAVLHDSETMGTIRELYLSCKKNKPILERLPDLEDKNDELIAETLQTNDVVHKVLKHYKSVIVPTTTTAKHKETNATTTAAQNKNIDILTDLLVVDNSATNTTTKDVVTASTLNCDTTTTQAKTSNDNVATLDELRDIFGALEIKQEPQPADFLNKLDLLMPETVSVATTATLLTAENEQDNKTDKPLYKELKEIDVLSDELFKKSLNTNDRIGSFKKEPEKVTLNDMAKEKMHVNLTSSSPATPTKQVTIIGNASTSSTLAETSNLSSSDHAKDEEMLSTETEIMEAAATTAPTSTPTAATAATETSQTSFKHLSDITLDLDDIVPIENTQRILLDDDDVQITLSFTKNMPSKNVSTIVMSATNKGKQLVKDFYFDASVRKPSKVRLLPATDNVLQPQRPFRAVVPVNQILLLFNPTGVAVDLTCIVGYTLGDDPDPIKESIIAKSIPYVE